MHNIIDLLQSKQLIWKGSQQASPLKSLSSGYPELDQLLGGGFPNHGVVAINAQLGVGELRLLTPYLKNQTEQRLGVFINPPGYLCASYLAAEGFNLDQLLIINTTSGHDALWAAELCLKSGCCGSVLLWQPNDLAVHQAKRLQIASETGRCLHFMLGQPQTQSSSLPISLSIQLEPSPHGISATISKRKGGWLQASIVVKVHQPWASPPPIEDQVVSLEEFKRSYI